MKFHIRHAEKVSGLFVIIAALALCGVVFFLGANQRWFGRDYDYTASFDSASGLSVGMAINLKGFKLGKITRLRLTETNKVEASLVIFDTYIDKARSGSVLELVTSPIGLGTTLLLHPGLGAGILAEGTALPTLDSEEGHRLVEAGLVDIPPRDDTVTSILSSVGPLLENFNKAVVTLNKTLLEANLALAGKSEGPLGQTLDNAASATARLGPVLDKAVAIEDSVMGITSNLAALTDAMRDPTGLVPRLLDPKGSVKTFLDDQNALYDSIMASVRGAQASIRSVQAMTASLNAQMPSVAEAIQEAQATIKKAQDVLESLRNNPLLKGGVPKAAEQTQLYQSLREGEF